jgi:hypothetical protein
MQHFVISLTTAISLVGCASAVQPTTGAYSNDTLGVQIETPEGWYQLVDAPRGSIILTKNGISLETITVGRFDLGEKLANSSKRFEAGMTAAEACDVDIDNHQFAPGIDGFKLLNRGTAVVGGHDCYQYSYSYMETSGQPRAVKDYGCIVGTSLYRFHYTAPADQWFPKFLPTFDQFVASARFTAASPSSASP